MLYLPLNHLLIYQTVILSKLRSLILTSICSNLCASTHLRKSSALTRLLFPIQLTENLLHSAYADDREMFRNSCISSAFNANGNFYFVHLLAPFHFYISHTTIELFKTKFDFLEPQHPKKVIYVFF